jgi:hypothetical protein
LLVGLLLLAGLAGGGVLLLQFAAPKLVSLTCDASGKAELCVGAGHGTLEYFSNGLELYSSASREAACKDADFSLGDVVKVMVKETGETLAVTCGGFTSQCADDGRLNDICDTPVTVFCTPQKIAVYAVTQSEQLLVFELADEEIRKLSTDAFKEADNPDGVWMGINPQGHSPATQVLIHEKSGIRLYAGRHGLLRIEAPQGQTKTYSLTWDGCQPIRETWQGSP